jgi:glycine dehydrogenase
MRPTPATADRPFTTVDGGHDLGPSDTFVRRHIGPSDDELQAMLATIGVATLGDLVDEAVPPAIRLGRELELGP